MGLDAKPPGHHRPRAQPEVVRTCLVVFGVEDRLWAGREHGVADRSTIRVMRTNRVDLRIRTAPVSGPLKLFHSVSLRAVALDVGRRLDRPGVGPDAADHDDDRNRRR